MVTTASRVGIELDVVAAPVPVADRQAQLVDALATPSSGGWPASARASISLATMCGGVGAVRVAHAEVDDVLAGAPRLLLQVPDDVEDVGRQALMRGKSFGSMARLCAPHPSHPQQLEVPAP